MPDKPQAGDVPAVNDSRGQRDDGSSSRDGHALSCETSAGAARLSSGEPARATASAHIKAAANDQLIAIAAFLSVVLAAILWVAPAVLRADIFDGDAAHHVWWLYRYADPGLFPGDITIDYFLTSAPLGYRALYAAIAPFVDALLAVEVLAAGLFALSGWLAWKIGTAIEGPGRSLRGLFAVATLIGMVAFSTGTDLLPAMAFQRTFALPLTLLCLWALMVRRYTWVGLSWVGSALFYPVLLPVLGLGAGCVFLRDMIVERRMPSQWIVNAGLAVAALALALFVRGRTQTVTDIDVVQPS